MGKNVVFLDENEIDNRIQNAVKNAKIGRTTKIYGVSGIGQENPKLTRTHDAAGITLTIEDDGDTAECFASDTAFQEFFNFPEHTDELGNVFLTITPKAFRIDRKSNGEILALSVKEYEDGDEEKGFILHSFFKNYISEVHYNGVVSRQIAKYLGYHNVATNQIESKPNKDWGSQYGSWETGRQIIKDTSSKYGIMSWMFVDLFRMLCIIYFGRIDFYNLFDISFPSIDATESGYSSHEVDSLSVTTITGTTDNIVSHTGFNHITNSFKIFNIDQAMCSITVDGCYHTEDGFYFSHLFDFDASIDEGAIKSTIPNLACRDSYGLFDVITKFVVDSDEFAFKEATAWRQAPDIESYNTNESYDSYYAAKTRKYSPNVGNRGQLYVFGYEADTLGKDYGAFYSCWNGGFGIAWNDSWAVRLCKSPS